MITPDFRKNAITTLCIAAAVIACSNNTFSQSLADSLSLQLKEQQLHSTLPGFTVAVVNKDTILYENAFGYADVATQKPYTIQTLKPIASVSKLFIGTAIMKGIEQKLFTLDTDIDSLLPFKIINPYASAASIKLSNLVTHTSGITDNPDNYKKSYFFYPPEPVTDPLYNYFKSKGYGGAVTNGDSTMASFLKNYLTAGGTYYAKKNFLKAAPGKVFDYSNIAAALAAYIIEYKAGSSFAAYTTKHILEPLQMSHSCWTVRNADQSALATLYTADGKQYPQYGSVCYPDGGLVTSGHELALFLKENMAGYYGHSKILSPGSYTTLMKPAFTEKNTPAYTDPDNPNIGVFYAIKKTGLIGHTGGDAGVTSFYYFNPAKGFGLLFITNTEIESVNGINEQVKRDFEKAWRVLAQFGEKLHREHSAANTSATSQH